MNSISVVIITFNEEENIGRCLDSVKSIADEIIVVDSFSTDRTREIASGFDVKFYQRKWEGFSSAKNFGNSLATKDWIFSIDADEALSPNLIKSILEFKKNTTPADSYSLSRLTNYCGHWVRHCGWYPDRKLRMWKREEGQWEGVLHEQVVFNKEITTHNLTGDLFHYSFPSIRHHVQTLNNYSDVAARDLVERNKKVNILIHVILNPIYTFFNKYFLRMGFLDGYYGFVICVLSAMANFLKYAKIRQMKRNSHSS